MGYEKQKCKRQLGLASFGPAFQKQDSFCRTVKIVSYCQERTGEKTKCCRFRTKGECWRQASHICQCLGCPAPSEETLLFLLPFILGTDTLSARTASLTEHIFFVIQSFPRDIFLSFFHNNFLELVHLGILDYIPKLWVFIPRLSVQSGSDCVPVCLITEQHEGNSCQPSLVLLTSSSHLFF